MKKNDIKKFRLNDEAEDLIKFIKDQGIYFAFISSGIDHYISQIAKHFGTDYYHANAVFEFDKNDYFIDMKYTDVDPQAKVVAINEFCKRFNISPDESIFIGDANNDLEAFKYTKRGILYRVKNQLNAIDIWKEKDDALQLAAWKKIDNLRLVIDIIKDINGTR
jgi:phosphoserine phosphatase